jgi:hypothetical protein
MNVLKQMGEKDIHAEYSEIMKKPGIKAELQRLVEDPSLLLKAKRISTWAGKPIGGLVKVLNSASELSEMSTRIGHMRRAIKYSESQMGKMEKLARQGKVAPEEVAKKKLDMEDATYIARAALDFSRGGPVGKTYNQIASFFNPWVQGLDVLARRMIKNPLKTASAIGTYITAPSLALHMINKGEQWYEDIPRDQRDMYWFFKTPNMEHPIKIPKPFEPGVIFGSGAERLYDRFVDGDKNAFDGYWSDVLDALSPSVLPQVLKPMLEVITNHDFYTGKTIESKVDEYKEVQDRKNVYTSQVASQVSKVLSRMNKNNQISPKDVDQLIRGYGGTLPDVINKQAIDPLLSKVDKNIPSRPSAGVEDIPFYGSFLQKNLEGNNQPTNDFYDLVDQLDKKAKRSDYTKSFEDENLRLSADRQMRDINKLQSQKRDIQEDLKMSPSEKGKQIKKLNKQITNLAREGLATYKKNK